MSTANEPDATGEPVVAGGDGADLRVEVVRGGDPGDEVLAAISTVLTRPVVLVGATDHADHPDDSGQSSWVRAARLEGIVPGRRITTIADLARPGGRMS